MRLVLSLFLMVLLSGFPVPYGSIALAQDDELGAFMDNVYDQLEGKEKPTDNIQDLGEEERTSLVDSIYNQLPPEDQEHLINEAQHVFDRCEKEMLFRQFHDCRCIAAEVLEEMVLDPNPSVTAIGLGDVVAYRCPNEPGTAGYAYTECIKTSARRAKGRQEEFCTCMGSEFAKSYKTRPNSYMPNIIEHMVVARSVCKAILSKE